MKLIDLEILPKPGVGWGSGKLEFGKNLTQLYASNGSGKTPVLQSVVFALGYPTKFRDDIILKCEAVQLRVSIAERIYKITRRFSNSQKDFDITVVEESSAKESSFYYEKDYTKYLFDLLGLSFPNLVSSSNEAVTPFMSTLLPVFYIDQDGGYNGVYKPPTTNFIKDQFFEMVRICLGVEPRNSFTAKKKRIELQAERTSLDERIHRQKNHIQSMYQESVYKNKTLDVIQKEMNELKSELDKLKSNKDVKNAVLDGVDTVITQKREEYREISKSVSILETRINGFDEIRNEIESEIQTLQLNEEAKRIFDSFKDICATPGCGLFIGSSESYGKNLLYLKDQIKDLSRNNEISKGRLIELSKQKLGIERQLDALYQKKNSTIKNSEFGDLIELIGEITEKLIDLKKEEKLLQKIHQQEAEFLSLDNLRMDIQNRIESLGSSGDDSGLAIAKFRTNFKQYIVIWLDCLQTHNVSRDVDLSSDLKITFGGEIIEQIKGSTRARVILAVHATLFQIFLEQKKFEFKVLILDTPRQHEMHVEDISSYITSLKSLAEKHDAQILFSTTTYRHELNIDDHEWLPKYKGPEQLMYLIPSEAKTLPIQDASQPSIDNIQKLPPSQDA